MVAHLSPIMFIRSLMEFKNISFALLIYNTGFGNHNSVKGRLFKYRINQQSVQSPKSLSIPSK